MKLLERAPFWGLNVLLYARWFRLILKFKRVVGVFPDIALPRSYHDKMLWRKLFDHNPMFEVFSDKLQTKAYVKAVCPSLSVPATHWVADEATACLRLPFHVGTVLKASHGCKMNYFVRDSELDFTRLIPLVSAWLRTTHGVKDHQWGYLHLQKKLFLEELIPANGPEGLLDISIRCADGRAVIGSVSTDIDTENVKIAYFDEQGKRILEGDGPPSTSRLPLDFSLPPAYSEAVSCAIKLSRGIDYARYDFLFNGQQLYAGEITVYPAAGLRSGTQGMLERMINEAWSIENSWFLTTRHRGWRSLYAKWLRRQLAV